MVVGEQEDDRELFVLRVVDSRVGREVLRAGDPVPGDDGWPLPADGMRELEQPPVSRVVARDEHGAG
ncbi:MAG: hypothetical protein AVDCRST_MAG48-2623 [uncultured Friedmanniella sp.]|uniref:Uncharacterized protein n=1 Tax=uncultured Friedmanniella sp. TaxID=335381 RepID=A0A6J4L0G5_9ACTN|nr:MAG: hypothetical protein AVDCRST_MAG48-2623 [uncultured Friedmanniella sp.]